MWFKKLTGFDEESPQNVRAKISIDGESMTSSINGQTFAFGRLEVLTLEQLKENSPPREVYKGKIKVSEIVADVQELHANPENAHALFQAASQFNLLEMVGPHITPEQGVDRYEHDYTQGPACAIACGAGTIYRNYFAEVNGEIGQTVGNQIDCLDLIGQALNNADLSLWTMRNGYALVSQDGLLLINKTLSQLSDNQLDVLKGKLKIGIQWETEVTISNTRHKVSQAYCSALPIAYSSIESMYWERFARLILEATYEATLYAALINMEANNSNLVYLTLVGGGAFGNDETWIFESLQKAIRQFKNVPLDVRVVSYRQSNLELVRCLDKI